MQRTMWLAVACASLSLAGAVGCASSSVRSDEAMLGRVPMERKHPVFTAENNISVARANVSTAQRAVEDAAGFRLVTDREFDLARSRVEASREAIDVGRKSGYRPTIEGGAASLAVARQQFAAAEAKRDYADRLFSLREKQLDAAKKRLDIAEHDLALARTGVIRESGMRPREDMRELRSDRNDDVAELAGLEKRIALLHDEVNDLRSTWNERRNAYNVASRNNQLPAIKPPPPPKMLEPEPLPAP